MNLHVWAMRHQVSLQALAELKTEVFGLDGTPPGDKPNDYGISEAAVQTQVRFEAAEKGIRIFRNNVGVLPNEAGTPIRFGLGNDSAGLNKVIKSGDLIGIRPVLITSAHLGWTLGQFVSREVKAVGWHYTGTPREEAQLAWAELVNAAGGDAAFVTGVGSL